MDHYLPLKNNIMDEVFLGYVMLWAGNFAPVGFIPCDGRQVSIADNEALFSLLGTIYGGDGMSTFCVPDLIFRQPA